MKMILPFGVLGFTDVHLNVCLFCCVFISHILTWSYIVEHFPFSLWGMQTFAFFFLYLQPRLPPQLSPPYIKRVATTLYLYFSLGDLLYS